MRTLRLSISQYLRLRRLARAGGRRPEDMLKFVLRDGFEFCEWQVTQSLVAEAEEKRVGPTGHEAVMREARALVGSAFKRK